MKQATPCGLHRILVSITYREDPADHEPDSCTAFLHKVQTLVYGFYKGGDVQEGTVVRSALNRTCDTVWHQEGLGNYIVSTGYLNKFRKTRPSLPTFRPWHTLTSRGPGTPRPQGGHPMDMDQVAGQRWSPYCQYSYMLFFRCLEAQNDHYAKVAYFSRCLLTMSSHGRRG